MENSLFYLQTEKNERNREFIDTIQSWCAQSKTQAYLVDRPLGDAKYRYPHKDAVVLLIPKRKICFVDFSNNTDSFKSFVDDFIEDLGSISDKFRYKDAIGRPRNWRSELVAEIAATDNQDLASVLNVSQLADPLQQRKSELLISLLTGSINDISMVGADIPTTRLDKIRKNILLFDGDQTRFVYQQINRSPIRIQGLSGTGKTELLMHKLKELYTQDDSSRIALTCHNRILADSLRRRIPTFFNFMKVEQQIKWNERLWCVHAWGSQNDPDSGTYRRICEHYNIPFYRYSTSTSFDYVCTQALADITSIKERTFAFDYLLIDESQDFPESFIKLCEATTSHTVYVAGDIFQSIFDENIIGAISPDFLLRKCYRTDPRTLMFAHSIGMGLFEPTRLRWLEDKEWEACGYIVEKSAEGKEYTLRREPLRRFEEIDTESYASVSVVPIAESFYSSAAKSVVDIIRKIVNENPTVTPADIGIIILDKNNSTYALADVLDQIIPREIGWEVNKAHETKQRIGNAIFVSNRYNVKGLEFPFVICVTSQIRNSHAYRNALYMTLTRSFLQSFLVISEPENRAIIPHLSKGLEVINNEGLIRTTPPSDAEKDRIKTTFTVESQSISFFDFAYDIFDEIGVIPLLRNDLLDAIKKTHGEDFDRDAVKETAEFLYARMHKGAE